MEFHSVDIWISGGLCTEAVTSGVLFSDGWKDFTVNTGSPGKQRLLSARLFEEEEAATRSQCRIVAVAGRLYGTP